MEETDNTEKTITITVTRKEWDMVVMALMKSENDLENAATSRKWAGDSNKGYRQFLRDSAKDVKKFRHKCLIAWIGKIPAK